MRGINHVINPFFCIFAFERFVDMGKKGFIVAIDGYSSTGKSTVAKLLAAQLGFIYIDTGAMYRVVTLGLLRKKLISNGTIDNKMLSQVLSSMEIAFCYNDSKRCYESYLNGELVEDEIRGMNVSANVSFVAALPEVRKLLVEKQREMGQESAVVMDGRDIGSVVFPHADVKFFMTASVDIRAERRYKELLEKGEQVTLAEVKKNVEQRDYIDTHRKTSPLVQVEDAVLIDTTNMTLEEEVTKMAEIIRKKYESRD